MTPAAPYGEEVSWQPATPRLRPLRLVISWIVAAASIWVAAALVPGVSLEQTGRRLRRRGPDRGPQRGAAAGAGRAAPAVHARRRLPARPVRRRAAARARRRGPAGRHPRRLLRRRAPRGARDRRRQRRAAGHPRARTTTTSTRCGSTRRIARRQGARERTDVPGHHLPGDRRARPARPARRDARRQRADDGALDRRGRLPARRVGDRPLLADGRQPGRDPARLQRGHPGVPLGREGDAAA